MSLHAIEQVGMIHSFLKFHSYTGHVSLHHNGRLSIPLTNTEQADMSILCESSEIL